MTYAQITLQERCTLSTLRQHGYSDRAIARIRDRSPSTLSREVRRNARCSTADWALVESVLCEDFSPEQLVGWCMRFGILRISHVTINRRHRKQLSLTTPEEVYAA